MEKLLKLLSKKERLVIGLMSGTSVDGIDAALVRISGSGTDSKAELMNFKNFPFDEDVRARIFKLFNINECRVDHLCHMNFLLGELFADAAMKLVKDSGLKMGDIDLIGSHGQTIYHIPDPVIDNGFEVRSTLQIGEPSVIAERTGVVTVADFRMRDMAAGGQGAPLVPYTEYILYRDEGKCIGLQNIGGIGNITVLPAGCGIDDVYAFDTGPGNMVIDETVNRVTNGRSSFDRGGGMASRGQVSQELLNKLMEDSYFERKPPKTTGREYFGRQYTDRLFEIAGKMGIGNLDIIATATALTAASIALSIKKFVIPMSGLDRLIIGGGGSYNTTLINMIKASLPGVLVLTQEDIGLNSDAKEAAAFALLANETINGNCNNAPGATGAKRKVILGKIII